jgi:hypothetical protein
MLEKTKWNMLFVNISIDILIVILLIILSKAVIYEKIRISLIFFVFGIFCSLFFALLFYIVYQFNKLIFQVFTLFFLINSLLGIIVIYINLFKDDPIVLSIIIPLVNIFILCLYIKTYIWKIDRDKYIEDKKQNKINRDNKKITI